MTYQRSGSSMLRCVLIAEDGEETVLTVPSLGDVPPSRVRVPSSLGGAAVLDVYAFSHDRDIPPEAVYMYVGTVPVSMDEITGTEPREQGPQLPE
ncbi:hypothetical protein [Leifsonia sp. NPDC077715]|uniref:hypothetical protein n=1 Tax=Leifsonia sp. NPDC077715 TaxID=3155539 RepID=UPI0034252D3B